MADSSYTVVDTAGSRSAAGGAYRTAITTADAVDLSALTKLPVSERSSIAVSAQFDNNAEAANLEVVLYTTSIVVGGATTYVTVGKYGPTTVTATTALAATAGNNMSPLLTVDALGASHFAVYVSSVTGTIVRLDAWTY